MVASISAWLVGNFLEEPVDFIFLGLSKADDVEVVFALGVGHVHYLTLEPPDRAKTKLAVCKALIFIDPDVPIEDSLAAWEVVAVLANVLSSLRVIPGRHGHIVATKSVSTPWRLGESVCGAS